MPAAIHPPGWKLRKNRLCTVPARWYRFRVETGTASCLTFLAADRQQRLPVACPTSPLKTRVRGFCRPASGRHSFRRRKTPINTPGLRGCGYKTASGRGKWPNRDPIEELGGNNLYNFVLNEPVGLIDFKGLSDKDCAKCADDFADCMLKGLAPIGVGGGAGGIGAGPHKGPKGNPRPTSRCGKPTKYGKGLRTGIGTGILWILIPVATECLAAELGCVEGCQPEP
jgi:hypothetical protein